MALAHRDDGTHPAPALSEITAEIYGRIDSFVIDLGRLLQIAFDHHRADYERWVTEDLPFGLDKARRLRMIHKATSELPPEVLVRLPRPWQAMFAISRLEPAQVIEAVESGDIHEDLTVVATNDVVRHIQGGDGGRGRHSIADTLAGQIVTHPVETLSPTARDLLASWLATAPS